MVVDPPTKDLPYQHPPTRKDKERQYARFLKIFKRLQINIPFSKTLEQMPTYAKLMKELLTKKIFIKQDTIQLAARCSSIFQNDFPQKLQDLGSFTIPITFGNLKVGRALLDLVASINLIHLSFLAKIGDLDVKPT